ncbi:MAG: hypothetical protein KGH78_02985 [Candidatus Micrarchaeota archaeon]|nr:hypothetical protein [Candidatus Micrarchaeota archaeon]
MEAVKGRDEKKEPNKGIQVAGFLSALFGGSAIVGGVQSGALPAEAVGTFFLVAGVTLYAGQHLFKPLLRG